MRLHRRDKDLRAIICLPIVETILLLELIMMVTFGMLLIVLWNFDTIDDFDQFYIDVDNSSLRKKLEAYLDKKIRISTGYLGILENSK